MYERRDTGGDPLAEIIRAAGKRRPPPPEHYDEVFAASRSAWRQAIRHRRHRRWLAAAAALLAFPVLGAILWAVKPQSSDESATVAVARGVVEQLMAGSDIWMSLGEGSELGNNGTRIRTGTDGGVALTLAAGGSLRLGANTEIGWTKERLALDAGLLYFDSRGRAPGASIDMATSFGVVRDIGTQFEILATDDRLRVRVRSGLIELRSAAGDDPIRLADAEMEVTAAGASRQLPLAPDSEVWAWAEALASAPDDGRHTVFEYLSWIAHEKGKVLTFSSPAAEQRARADYFGGDPTGLTPLELLAVIAATSSFRYEMQDDATILIRR
jgi:ferric-dicitrate binding protein FerR (iron transport regulator)